MDWLNLLMDVQFLIKYLNDFVKFVYLVIKNEPSKQKFNEIRFYWNSLFTVRPLKLDEKYAPKSNILALMANDADSGVLTAHFFILISTDHNGPTGHCILGIWIIIYSYVARE